MIPAKQDVVDEKESTTNIRESQKTDTGYSPQLQAVPISISHQDIDLDPNPLDDQLQDQEIEDPTEQDTLVYQPDTLQDEYNSQAIEDTHDSTTIQMGKQAIEPFTTPEVRKPNEKVGCIFVTE